jgi:hypothetical protein
MPAREVFTGDADQVGRFLARKGWISVFRFVARPSRVLTADAHL